MAINPFGTIGNPIKKKLNPLATIQENVPVGQGPIANTSVGSNFLENLKRSNEELKMKIEQDTQPEETPTFDIKPAFDWETAPSPFTKENAPTQTGALSGQGVTQGAEPLKMVQGVEQPVVASMEGRKNIPKDSVMDSIVPKANAGESIDTNLSQQAISDIHAGMPIDELSTVYPELAMSKGLFEQYASDVKAGMPQSEGEKMYPELFGKPAPTEAPKGEAGLWDYTKGLAGRIGEGVAQVPSDIINVGAEAIGSDFRAQPLSQSLFGITPSSEKGVIGRSADIIEKSGKNIGEIFEQAPNQTMPESIYQGTAETLFGASNVLGEVFMAGLSTLAPDVAKQKLTSYIQEVAKTKGAEKAVQVAKQIGDQYNEFAKNNPRAARNLKAFAQLGSVALEVAGIGKGKKVITDIGEKTGDIAQKTGEMVGKTGEVIGDIGGKTAGKLEVKALNQLRKDAEEIALPTISELGKKQKGEIFQDVVETGKGPFKKTEIVRSPKEALAIEETTRLMQEGKLKKGMSEIQKNNVIKDEIENLSKTLEPNLRASEVNMSKDDVNKMFTELSQQILDNPTIVGDAETSLKKLLPTLQSKLTKEVYYPEDILQLRKDFDSAIRKAKGDGIFDPKTDSAFSTALRDFRQGLNTKVAEMVPDANVKQILDRQSSLYTIEKTLSDRFSSQANTLVGRMLNKVQGITGVPRTEIVELATALGLAGAVSPIVAPISLGIGASYLAKKGYQAITSPQNKKKIAEILRKFEEAVKSNPSKAKEINGAKQEFEKMINPKKNDNILNKSTDISKPVLGQGAVKPISSIPEAKSKVSTTENAINNQKIAYHGTQVSDFKGTPKTSQGTMGDAFYLSDDAKKAESFGKDKMVSEFIINAKGEKIERKLREPGGFEKSNVFNFDLSKIKIKEVSGDPEFNRILGDADREDASYVFRLSGYDGVYNKATGTYAIYSPEKLIKITKPIKNEQIKPQSPIGTIQQNDSKFNPLDLSKNKKGSLNIGQIGKDLGLIKKDKSIEPLTKLEEDMIYKYTNMGGGTSKPMAISEQKKISEIIKKLPVNNEKIYSGLKLSPDEYSRLKYSGNDGWESKRLLSTSTEKAQAQEFMRYNPEMKNEVMLEIKWGGHNISEHSSFQNQKSFSNENEVLFPFGTKFDVEMVNDNYFVLTPKKQTTGIIKSPIQKVPDELKPKMTQNKKGSLNIGQIGKDLGLIKKDKSIEPLIEEAKKYKSAEEFVKNTANYMHGGYNEIKSFGLSPEDLKIKNKIKSLTQEQDLIREKLKYGQVSKEIQKLDSEIQKLLEKFNTRVKEEGFYFTNDNDYVKTFDKGYITKAKLDLKNPLKIGNKDINIIEDAAYNQGIIERLKKQGYDSIILNDGEQVLVFNSKNIKTEAQLKDIYNKANKK